jgi:hypothetical protein
MEDDVEGLLHAFDAFIEFLYTGDYKDSTSVLDAHVVVLAERIVADGLKEAAIAKLETSLSTSKCVSPPLENARIDDTDMIEIVRTVYGGTHRPFAELKPSDFATLVCNLCQLTREDAFITAEPTGYGLIRPPFTDRSLPTYAATYTG